MRTVRALLVVAAMAAFLAFAAPAGAASFSWMDGYDDPATPDTYDKVGVLKEGPANARKVLILLPGTSGGAGYLEPVAQDIVSRMKGWQVWSIERRENLFEDHSRADMLKRGEITPAQFNNYYLGWMITPTTPRIDLSIPGFGYAGGWGMRVAVEDVKHVVDEARKHSRQVVLGGHSLGGSIATAYATWDFDGRAGGDDLSGLVFVDGGSGPASITPAEANAALEDLVDGTPWSSFGGIPTPFAGLFNIVGAGLAKTAPNELSLAQALPLLPSVLKPPVPATNEAQYGYGLDTDTSPPFLAAAHVNAGQLAESGDPRPWVAGDISPIQRVADAFYGTGLPSIDGTAWYHPTRLSLDSRAVGAGNANPAQEVLDVQSIHGADLNHMRLYAFAAALGGQRVLDAAELLARQSHIRSRDVVLVDGSDTYAHVDPLVAYPQNDFVDELVPFLRKTKKVKAAK